MGLRGSRTPRLQLAETTLPVRPHSACVPTLPFREGHTLPPPPQLKPSLFPAGRTFMANRAGGSTSNLTSQIPGCNPMWLPHSPPQPMLPSPPPTPSQFTPTCSCPCWSCHLATSPFLLVYLWDSTRLHLLWAPCQLLQRAPLLPLEPRAQPVLRTRSFGRTGARNGTTSPLVWVPFWAPRASPSTQKADTQLDDDGQTGHLKCGVPEQNAIIWISSDQELSLPSAGTHTSVKAARGTLVASSVLCGAHACASWHLELEEGPGSEGGPPMAQGLDFQATTTFY